MADNLNELQAKRAELESKKRELELEIVKLSELEKMRAAEEPLTVRFLAVEGQRITFEMSRYDDLLLGIFKQVPSRSYHGNGKNSIDVIQYPVIESALIGATVGIEISDIIRAQILEVLNKPDLSVSMDGRGNRIIVKINNIKFNSNPFRSIPGHKWDQVNYAWMFPAHEGWRVYELLKDKKVEWDAESLSHVEGDLSRRAKLDGIAQLQDIDLGIEPLNGLTLYPFQRVGVEFMRHSGYRCIDSDQPGLGKTPQFIAACKLLEKELGRPVRAAIFCPASLKRNWAIQIVKFTGERSRIFKGLSPNPIDVLTHLDPDDKPKWAIYNYDIVAAHYESSDQIEGLDGSMIKSNIMTRYPWMELINASGYDIVGVDEAHYIKNVESYRSKAVRQIKCERVIFLTATPVMNRPRELWPLLNVLVPGLFPSNEVFLGTYEDGNGRARNTTELVELLKPLMIRRLKKDVVKELPPINRIYEFYELSPKAQKMYLKILKGIYETIEEWGGNGDDTQITSILAKIMRLKQVCAIDKMDMIAELAIDLFDAGENGDTNKVLVFSQFVPVARGIAKRLGQEALCVTGEVAQDSRDELVHQFQTNPSVHFMVATKGVLSEGKDLTKAGHVIFADLFWTPAAHEQAEGRAYGRLNELHSINSYYTIAKQEGGAESIEDWIQQILAKKLAVIEEVVDGVEGSRSASIAGELLSRIKEELFSRKAR